MKKLQQYFLLSFLFCAFQMNCALPDGQVQLSAEPVQTRMQKIKNFVKKYPELIGIGLGGVIVAVGCIFDHRTRIRLKESYALLGADIQNRLNNWHINYTPLDIEALQKILINVSRSYKERFDRGEIGLVFQAVNNQTILPSSQNSQEHYGYVLLKLFEEKMNSREISTDCRSQWSRLGDIDKIAFATDINNYLNRWIPINKRLDYSCYTIAIGGGIMCISNIYMLLEILGCIKKLNISKNEVAA